MLAALPNCALAQTASAPAQPVLGLLGPGSLESILLKYHGSGQCGRELNEVGDRAKAYLGRQARRSGKVAMVLDIDEPSLSTWPEIRAHNFEFIADGPCDDLRHGPCGWSSWALMAQDAATRPTLELNRQARRQGVAVFFITGRHEIERKATERNLRTAGYSDWTELTMEPTR